MRGHLYKAFSLLLVIALGAFLARRYGWYSTYWFTDVILHIIAGVMFGFVWLVIARDSIQSRKLFFLTIILFTVFGGYLWEIWEFIGSVRNPDFALAYVPSLADTLSDIAWGMLGGVLVGLWARSNAAGV
ncbi:hypothetical protein KW800_00375 [Candidatus Parcubacteria bacterium]|nr:hypothetical protein [Candidatus Parcubacteria bacterium]